MKVGDRVRIKVGTGYTKETYKVVKMIKGTKTIVADVTNNSYGIGWLGKIEKGLELEPYHLYWYSECYIKVDSKKLFI